MYCLTQGECTRPKLIQAVELAIFNDQAPPLELLGHIYRKLFKLSYKQLADEPIDQIMLALEIEKLLQEKQERDNNSSNN